MDTQIEDENIDAMDELELRDWAGRAVLTIERMRKTENLLSAFEEVLNRGYYSVSSLHRAAADFIKP